MNRRNYQRELEDLLKELPKGEKTLLLHSCCAPCSSYVMQYLSSYFPITVFYYNPNISESEEYQKRVAEQKRLIAVFNERKTGADGERVYPISVIEGDYEPERFERMAKGLEDVPEGGERCFGCFALRLSETAKLAAALGMDYFTTTLTISPLKNAEKINEIGERIAAETGTLFLPSDFKKKDGYLTSIRLSKEYDLYRQDYCGCRFSKKA